METRTVDKRTERNSVVNRELRTRGTVEEKDTQEKESISSLRNMRESRRWRHPLWSRL